VACVTLLSIPFAIAIYWAGCYRARSQTEGEIAYITRNLTPTEIKELLVALRKRHRSDPFCWGQCYGSSEDTSSCFPAAIDDHTVLDLFITSEQRAHKILAAG
jgi:hypothetical protein